jgi:hypothetical protein
MKMGRTVRELMLSMDAIEFQDWKSVYEADPWSEERADLRAGIIASTVANCLTDKSSWMPSDFMPEYGTQPEPEPKSMEELRDIAIRMAAMMGGMNIKQD